MKWYVETLTHINERHEIEADSAEEAGERAARIAHARALKQYGDESISLVEPILWSRDPESGHTALLPK